MLFPQRCPFFFSFLLWQNFIVAVSTQINHQMAVATAVSRGHTVLVVMPPCIGLLQPKLRDYLGLRATPARFVVYDVTGWPFRLMFFRTHVGMWAQLWFSDICAPEQGKMKIAISCVVPGTRSARMILGSRSRAGRIPDDDRQPVKYMFENRCPWK